MDFVENLKVGDNVLVRSYGLGGGLARGTVAKRTPKRITVTMIEHGHDYTFDLSGHQYPRMSGFGVNKILEEVTEENLKLLESEELKWSIHRRIKYLEEMDLKLTDLLGLNAAKELNHVLGTWTRTIKDLKKKKDEAKAAVLNGMSRTIGDEK
jgi:hypothetical protein